MRRLLLALLFCSTAWAVFARVPPAPAQATRTAVVAVSSEMEAGTPRSTGAESQWQVAYRVQVSTTESLWRSSAVHADLAAAPSGDVFVETATVDHRARPARTPSAHLLDIPLLI